jgi:VanZ family protein
MKALKRRHMAILLFALYLAAVAYLCFLKPGSIPVLRQFIFGIPTDKVIHFIMFLPYPILAYISFCPDRKGVFTHMLALIAIIAVGAAMAMGVERLQIAAGRNYDIKDFYANISGMAAGAAITLIFILARHRLDK